MSKKRRRGGGDGERMRCNGFQTFNGRESSRCFLYNRKVFSPKIPQGQKEKKSLKKKKHKDEKI
jgi:hypothetical protein